MTQAQRIKLFLSYAMKDDGNTPDDPQKSLMRRLYNDLTARNFEVWWDHVSMPSRGLPMSKEIEDALRDCDRFVLIVGERLRESRWAQAELAYARSLCKPITLIFRGGTLGHFPDGMDSTRALDFRPPREYLPTFEGLVDRLQQDAPIGETFNVRPLPDFLLERPVPFQAARDSVCATTISPTVISAPAASTTISGYAGIGKSTLAVMLAHDCDVRRFFKDGIIWVSVGQTPIITELQAQIGVNVFGDSRENYKNADNGRKALLRVLRDKAALIILDDVWENYLIEQFPVAETACRLLITTRSRTLARQINGKDIFLPMLTDREGAALIALRAGGSSDDPTYQQIAQMLGGHTLAIRLAAEQLVNQYADSAADLLSLLKQQENLFTHLKLTEDNKDENVERSLSLSYSALAPEMQRRFRALGVLAVDGSFNRSMLAALWGENSEAAVRLSLSAFVAAGLINNDNEGRYSQHRLLRAYAHALLAAAGELENAFSRYADHVIAQAAQFETLPLEQWSQLDPLLPHVNEIGECLTNQWETAQQADSPDDNLTRRAGDFALNVRKYVSYRPQMIETPRGRERLGLHWLEMGLAISRKTGDQQRESLFCNEIGIVWDDLGEKRKALDYYEQSLLLKRAISDRRGEAVTLHNIGAAWNVLGDTRAALEYFDQALLLLRALGDQGGEATTLTSIGIVWDTLGEPRKALDYYEQSLPLRRAVGDRGGEATSLNNIGLVWNALGEPRKALEYFDQALPLRRAVGDQVGEAVTLTSIGVVWNDLGEPHKALDYDEQALLLCRAVGDRRGEAVTLNSMATIHYCTSEFNKAAAMWQQIIPIVQDIGAVADEAAYRVNIATAYERMGRIDDAIQSAEVGKAILMRYHLPQDAGGSTIAQIDVFLVRLRGQFPKSPPQRGFLGQLGNLLRSKRGKGTKING